MMQKALLLAGDYYHDPQAAYEGHLPLMKEAGLEVTCTEDNTQLTREALADCALLCILRDGMNLPDGPSGEHIRWMTPAQESAIEQFVTGGGAFLALHNAGWDYPNPGPYRRTLGGYYIGHPPSARFHVEVLNQDHPVTAGVASYDITDEQHMLTCDHDRVTPLLRSTGQDGRGTVSGWAYEYGFGRVVYLPHGHTLPIIQHPSNVQLVRNALRWLLRRG